MADDWGVDDGYWDVSGAWHATPDHVRQALRSAMGGGGDDDDTGRPPGGRPAWIVRHGERPAMQRGARLVLEDGAEVDTGPTLPPDLPLGYHDLHPDDGGPPTRLIVVPHRASPPPERARAMAVQLYAARSRRSWGIGDLGDLGDLARWAARHGLDALLVSPLHAPLPVDEPEPSPYFASSRCWRSPLHLRIPDVEGYDAADPTLTDLAQRGAALDADRRIDRAAAWALKRAALATIWERSRGGGAGLAFWRATQGPALERFATFCALAEHHGGGWHDWPERYRHPDSPEVARFAARHAGAVDFHAWIQWQADRQHSRVASTAGLGLVHDLAVGSSPDGADAWLWQGVMADGVRVGAPPDEFNAEGQDWGIPPFVPWRLRDAGYAPLAELFRASFRHAAGLRVDHAMGLFRLWWVPAGAGPAEGGYVRYPGHELLDILALESVRAGAFVVGEDLGTVEDGVRDALGDRGVLSYRVAWFEDDPPEQWPSPTLASLTTHDLPTVAGVWSGDDDGDGVMRRRLATLVGEPWPTSAVEASVRAHGRLSAAPSAVASATMEDLLAVPERPNRPGTVTSADQPNWSVALPVPIDDLDSSPAPDVLASLTGSSYGPGHAPPT